ncbi:MAG: SUMF1/EgtB/PvdO family nonheme iron enzyme [Chitinivibrionia bacterium]|nr:SUMF1/EgtB/PvdO family nonheme iron enzyme [Chitinivibrionia bacterium]
MKINNLLKLLAIALSIATNLWAFAGGNGTAADPFIITTADHLNAVRNNLSAHYRLANNITLTEEWVSIPEFNGTFNGGGNTVSGVRINNTLNNQAFFSVMNGAVKGLLLDVDITGGIFVAALAAVNWGTIEECKVSGVVKGALIGGLVAENRGAIRNSFSLVETTAQFILEFPVVTSLPSNPVEGQGVRLRVEHNTITARSTYIDLVYVAPGEFTQGGAHFGDNNTRPVRLTQGFWIGRYPITQAQWQAIMVTNPSAFTGAGRENHPVSNVSWNDVQPFIAAIGARLPTAAEWEFAARGGNRRDPFAWAGSDNVDDVAWHNMHPDRIPNQTMPIGLLAPNGLGIFDMSGNVQEWVSDLSMLWTTTTTTAVNPTGGTTGSNRVVRGGSWSHGASHARVANRSNGNPDDGRVRGFRVAFSPQF